MSDNRFPVYFCGLNYPNHYPPVLVVIQRAENGMTVKETTEGGCIENARPSDYR